MGGISSPTKRSRFAAARPHDPESRVVDQVGAGVAVDVRGHDDFLAIVAYADVGDLADLDVLVADFGFVLFQTLGILEAYFDRRALFQLLANDHEAAGQNHDSGQNPYQRQAAPKRARRFGGRQVIDARVRFVAHAGGSHSRRSSKVRAANRVRTTTAAKANAPQPTATYARDLICTSATSSEMA
jgi:hypothetical protein